uniref:Uncharacterized protein n=1 Tax=Anopheles stephensi TaxID=30069 RepID=A0A182YRY5_ANOST
MKSKLKVISQVAIFVLLLTACSRLLAVECAPTVGNNPVVESSLHVLPLEQSADEVPSNGSHSRTKRAIIFRPLFVYRQQQIKKQRVR